MILDSAEVFISEDFTASSLIDGCRLWVHIQVQTNHLFVL